MTRKQSGVMDEEIRFAVVLNGGVSLAVWMGGVVRELDRLTWGGGPDGRGPYHELLRMVGCRARADVIAGTSAGGINGAALALAQVNANADLGSLRDLWALEGRLESMLRQPFRGSPASLLQGDEFFLPQLSRALRQLAAYYEPREPADRPIDLTITTTLLTGARQVSVDGLGQRLPQTVHEGRFHFGWDLDESSAPAGHPQPRRHFAMDQIADTVRRLALAARCTAGFPVAFEPSFVPVNENLATGVQAADLDLRPDMGEVASWANPKRDGSRFAIDGGVLVNTPTKAVLEAVSRMPAAGPVRRVVLLVFPHASGEEEDHADLRVASPPLTRTFARILAAQSSQGSRTHVEEVERHNVRAAARRSSRMDLLRTLAEGEPPQALIDAVAQLDPHYRRLRARRAARDLAQRVPGSAEWPYERIRAAAEAAQLQWRQEHRGSLPYVPDILPPAGVGSIADPGSGWDWGISTAERLADCVLDLLKRLVWVVSADVAETIARQREDLHRLRGALRDWRFNVDDLWITDQVLAALAPDHDYWTLRLAAYRYATQPPRSEGIPTEVPNRLKPVWAAATKRLGAPTEVGEGIRANVVAIATIAHQATEVLKAPETLEAVRPDDPLGRQDLGPWWSLLCAAPTTAEMGQGLSGWQLVLSRLLGLDVLTSALGEEAETGAELPVELVQVSLQTPNAFAQYSVTPDDKGAGMAINRFSGFLKQSWRLNDWTWGRVDAATMLCRVILDPHRLRRVAVLENRLTQQTPTSPEASVLLDALVARLPKQNFDEPQVRPAAWQAAQSVRTLIETTFGTADAVNDTGDPIATYLKVPSFDTRLSNLALASVEELIPVYDPRVPLHSLPRYATNIAHLAAWGMHLHIALEEIPALASAVRADRVEGANVRSRGELFVKTNVDLLRGIADLPPPNGATTQSPDQKAHRIRLGAKALEAFDRAGIGHEALGEEATSDQMIRTAVTAAGVAVTVLDGDQFGVPATKPITKTLRGAALLPYWAIVGLTRGGVAGRFLAILALAIGGVLTALALLGALPEWGSGPAAAIGAGALLSVFGYAAMRSGTLVHGLVLLSPVIPLVVYAIENARANPSASQSVSVVVIIALLVGGLIVLASLPAPVRSPIQTLFRPLRALKRSWPLLVLAVAAVAAGAFIQVAAIRRIDSYLTPRLDDLTTRQWQVVGMVAALAFLGTIGVIERRLLWTLRLWHFERNESGSQSWSTRPIVHADGTAAQWCIVYGLAYVAVFIAVLIIAGPPDRTWRPWHWAVLITCAVFPIVLLLVAPWWLPLRARARIRAQLLAEATPWLYGPAAATEITPTPAPPAEQIQEQLRKRLIARGQTYRFLLNLNGQAGEPQLTATGQRLATLIEGKLHRMDG